MPGQFKIEFPSEDEISDKGVKNEDENKTDSNNKDDDENPAYYVAYWRKEMADKKRKEKEEVLARVNNQDEEGQVEIGESQKEREEKRTRDLEHNQPDEPDYYMRHWIDKNKKKKTEYKNDPKENPQEGGVKKEIPREIWEELNSIGKVIQNRIMFLSETDDVYQAGSYSWIKESTQRLRNNNNREDANELSRLGGALTRVRYCRKLLQEGLLDKFVSYIKKLPTEKGASCPVILNLVQYDRLLKMTKELE